MRQGHHADIWISRDSKNQARAELEARIGAGGAGLAGFALATLLPNLLGGLGIGGSKSRRSTDAYADLKSLFGE
jgi:hypothetical protein